MQSGEHMKKGQLSTETLFLLFGIVFLFLVAYFVFKPSFLPCQTGDTKTITCLDGSLRIASTCFGSNWRDNVVDCSVGAPTAIPTQQQLRGCAYNEPACGIGNACVNNVCQYILTPTPGQDCRTSGCPSTYQCTGRDFGQGTVYLCQATSTSQDCRTYGCGQGQYCAPYDANSPNYVCKSQIQLYPSPSPTATIVPIVTYISTPTPTIAPLTKNSACYASVNYPSGHYTGYTCQRDDYSSWGRSCVPIFNECPNNVGGGIDTICSALDGFKCMFP